MSNGQGVSRNRRMQGWKKKSRAYCKKAEALHEKLPLAGFATQLKVPIDIEDIYVPLRAMMDLRATGQAMLCRCRGR